LLVAACQALPLGVISPSTEATPALSLAVPVSEICQWFCASCVAPKMGLPVLPDVICGAALSTWTVIPADGVSWLPAMSVARVRMV
jgi:hypothetical protein